MSETSFHTRLYDFLRWMFLHEQELVAGLSDTERSVAGSLEQWSPKDMIAHIAFWRGRQTRRLDDIAQGIQPPGDDREVDEVNAEAYAERCDWSWEQVLLESEQSLNNLIAALGRMSEQDLTDPQRYPWRNGQPLILSVLGNGVWHPLFHLSERLVRQGNFPQALQLQEQMTDGYIRVFDTPATRGLALYNLACFYAINGLKQKAIDTLSEALRLRPDLVEYSKQDPDFESVREDPAFQAVYE